MTTISLLFSGLLLVTLAFFALIVVYEAGTWVRNRLFIGAEKQIQRADLGNYPHWFK
jgi:hypothetical protein